MSLEVMGGGATWQPMPCSLSTPIPTLKWKILHPGNPLSFRQTVVADGSPLATGAVATEDVLDFHMLVITWHSMWPLVHHHLLSCGIQLECQPFLVSWTIWNCLGDIKMAHVIIMIVTSVTHYATKGQMKMSGEIYKSSWMQASTSLLFLLLWITLHAHLNMDIGLSCGQPH